MKVLLTILLLLPAYLFAQHIDGIWTGYLTTSERKLPYEVVISDSSGQLSGFSHITFDVKGKEIIAVKKVSVVDDDGTITLEDLDIIDDNFTENGPKRIKQIATLTLTTKDSNLVMVGTFKTKKVNDLRPISGNIFLEKKRISDTSRLMAKLNDMNLSGSLSFLQLQKQTGKVTAETVAAPQSTPIDNNIASRRPVPLPPPVIIPKKPVAVQPKDTVAVVTKQTVVTKPVAIAKQKDTVIASKQMTIAKPVTVKPKEATAVIAPPKVIKPVTVAQPKPKEVQVIAAAPKVVKPEPPPVVTKPVVIMPKQAEIRSLATIPAEPDAIPAGAGKDIAKRKIENIKTLFIETDSIVVTLYDNGYVDGDTVTIFLNGKVIMGKVGLSTVPVTKTVHITPDLGDSLQFVMYAENLGSIPPNTGLMILMDGKKRYEIFFSGDLEKNAAITLRRKHDDLN